MPGESPQSGASATPRLAAGLSMASSWRTTVLLPPRSAKWHPALMAARARPTLKKYGTAESAAA